MEKREIRFGVKPIRGTWLNLAYMDVRNKHTNPLEVDMNSPDLWRLKIKEMSGLGIKYLILMAVANEGKAYYESDFMPPAYMLGRESPISAIMKAADECDLKVFMSCGWAVNQDDEAGNPNIQQLHLTIMRETASKFGGHRSFYGWYFPCEDFIAPCFSNKTISSVNSLSAEARRLTPKAKLLVSPNGLYAAVIDQRYVDQLAKLHVDIIAYQDEVGCVRAPFPLGRMKENFARLRFAHDQVPHIALWANVESFTWDGNANDREVALVPAAFPRLLSQMAGVSPYADEVVSFIVQGMCDKPESRFPVGQPFWSARMAQNYKEFLEGKGRWPLLTASFFGDIQNDAVGKSVTLAAPPSSKYSSGGLTNGKVGVERVADPQWLGFETVDMEATIDLGQIMLIKTMAARFLQYAKMDIRLPSQVDFEISDDKHDFKLLASVMMERWQNDKHDCWIDMAVADGLKDQGRYVRVHAVNAGRWLFVDELLVLTKREYLAPIRPATPTDDN